MKLQKVENNSIREKFENFRKEKKSVKEELKFDDKYTIEVPLLTATVLMDIQNREEQLKKILAPSEKDAKDFVDQEEGNRKKSEKEAKNFKLSEAYLNENFKDRWSLNEGTCSVKCKGRRELRQLIEQCKLNNIKYKFTKKVDEDYKYDFTYNIGTGLQPTKEEVKKVKKEEPIKEEIKPIKEDYGWSISLDNAENAWEEWKETVGVERAADDLALSIGHLALADSLAYIFRMNDFRSQYLEEGLKEVKENLVSNEPKKDSKPLNEDLDLIGDLKDFNPSPEAEPLWNEINEKGLFLNFKQILKDLYPKGVDIETLNELLAVSDDFIREMLKMDNISSPKETTPVEEVKNDVEIEKEPEIEEISPEEAEEDVSVLDAVLNSDDEEETTIPETEPSPKAEENREKYLNTSTGYDEEDEDEDDVSDIASLVR